MSLGNNKSKTCISCLLLDIGVGISHKFLKTTIAKTQLIVSIPHIQNRFPPQRIQSLVMRCSSQTPGIYPWLLLPLRVLNVLSLVTTLPYYLTSDSHFAWIHQINNLFTTFLAVFLILLHLQTRGAFKNAQIRAGHKNSIATRIKWKLAWHHIFLFLCILSHIPCTILIETFSLLKRI